MIVKLNLKTEHANPGGNTTRSAANPQEPELASIQPKLLSNDPEIPPYKLSEEVPFSPAVVPPLPVGPQQTEWSGVPS